MNFLIKESYNMDLLNFFNVLTGNDFYTKYHMEAYAKYKDILSEEAKNNIKAMAEINSSAMLGPIMCLVISAVPDFNSRKLQEILADKEQIKHYFSNSVYFDEEEWNTKEKLIDLVILVVNELEERGFYKYWIEERLPKINECMNELKEFALQYNLQEEIESMLGITGNMEDITLYLCSFASPHGMKICGNNYISDYTFPMETTLLVAVHEMFHPPYDSKNLKNELNMIAEEPFFKKVFETKDPRFGYTEIDGFIEENVVEAMGLFVGEKLGLVKDTTEYLKNHDEGSHVLSVILMKYFKLYPKTREQSFEDYFKYLVKQLPFGKFEREIPW